MNSKQPVKLYRPESQPGSQVYKSIVANMKRSISRDRLDKNSSNSLSRSKSINQTVYRCGCVVSASKLPQDGSSKLELIVGQKKPLEVRLISQKSLESFSKIKNSRTIETTSKKQFGEEAKTKLKKSRRFKMKDSEGKLKKLLKQLAALKEEQGHLEDAIRIVQIKSEEDDRQPRREVIKYVPVQQIKVVDRVRKVEIPKEKIVRRIKSIPKEVVEYKETIVELPTYREELVFVDPEPQPPNIKEKLVVQEIRKEVPVKNPANAANQRNLEDKERRCLELGLYIKSTEEEIECLKRQMQLQQIERREVLKAAKASTMMNPNLPLSNPQVSIVLTGNQGGSEHAAPSYRELQQASPVISRFEIEETSSPNVLSVPSNSSFVKKSNANESTVLSGRSTITRITSEGRILGTNYHQYLSPEPVLTRNATEQQLFTSTSAGSIQNASAVISVPTIHIASTNGPTQIKTSTRVVRKYCKKNCGDVCTCMSDMFTVITRSER